MAGAADFWRARATDMGVIGGLCAVTGGCKEDEDNTADKRKKSESVRGGQRTPGAEGAAVDGLTMERGEGNQGMTKSRRGGIGGDGRDNVLATAMVQAV